MRHALRRCLFATLALLTAGARADEVAAGAPMSVALTVYRAPQRQQGALRLNDLQGFALVTETRRLAIPVGESRVRFDGVADGIEPASALITGLPAAMLEKNRDARILSAAALVEANRNRPVTLLRTAPRSGTARAIEGTIRSDAGGGVVFESAEGLEALRCSGLPETFRYGSVGDLAATPTLSVLLRSDQPLEATVTLSYLARGLDWSADYVATLSPDGRFVDLGAWVTLANGNGVSFPAAQAEVVAGRLNHDTRELHPLRIGAAVLAQCWPRGSTSDAPVHLNARLREAAPMRLMKGALQDVMVTASRRADAAAPGAPMVVVQEELGDLKLYRVPEPTTVASRQAKQIRLLTQDHVPVDLIYGVELRANAAFEAVPAQRLLRTRNDSAHHLGLPLPSGHVVSFASAPSATVLLGESDLRDVALDEEFEIGLGSTPDVAVSTKVIPAVAEPDTPWSAGVPIHQVEVSNSSRSDVAFELKLHLPDGETLLHADHPVTMRYGRPLCRVTVPGGQSVTIRYQRQRSRSATPVR